MHKKLSKREFIKCSATGVLGTAFYVNSGSGLAKSFIKPPLKESPSMPKNFELWKWSKESMYYVKSKRGMECMLCPQYCILKKGETGECKDKIHIEDGLYNIAYGNPCAIHIDPIEKKPLFHFLPESRAYSIATAGCNLSCINCQNWTISQKSPRDTRNYDLMPSKVVAEALGNNCQSIAYTYSEPIAFFEYTYDTAKLAKEAGVKNVMVSAGYINEDPLRDLCQHIHAANIDLKSFSNQLYIDMSNATLEPVLNTLKIMKEEGVWLEITNLLVPDWTDDMRMIKELCEWLVDNGLEECPLHFSRFQPMYKLKKLHPTPVGTLTQAREIALKAGVKFVYLGNVFGLDAENTYCPNCNKLLIKRKGYRILKNIMNDGKCPACGRVIPGVWKS